MRFDVFVPSRMLAFEYHGEQHFRDTFKVGGQIQSSKWDESKAAICLRAGITLLEVDFDHPVTTDSIEVLLKCNSGES